MQTRRSQRRVNKKHDLLLNSVFANSNNLQMWLTSSVWESLTHFYHIYLYQHLASSSSANHLPTQTQHTNIYSNELTKLSTMEPNILATQLLVCQPNAN